MNCVKLNQLFCCVIFIAASVHISFSTLQERGLLLDGLQLQIQTMRQRPVFPPDSSVNLKDLNVAVVNIIVMYNLQKDLVIVTALDEVLARIMQATTTDTCAWLKTQVDSFMGNSFNCTDNQLQGLKSWIQYETEIRAAQKELFFVFRENGDANHRLDYPTWLNTHFNCSDPENVALRQYLKNETSVSNILCR